MNITPLDTLIVGPDQQATASIIWLHGLGADGYDFEPIVPELRLPDSVRFIFPHAPVRPVTLNDGICMRAWYDIESLREAGRRDDIAGISASQHQIEQLIAAEVELGVGPERIVLAGFSQGGAIALHTGLRYPQRLAGIIALSTYSPLYDRLQDERHPANAHTPVFMAHGVYDPVVPIELGELSRDRLLAAGQPVEWRQYIAKHTVCIEKILDLAAWLRRLLALS